jgi:aminoglycoside phosphotransferase family enzyme/predicted kinase
VFLGTDTVWKLKKAVRLPFLDFTAAAERRRFARRELELNAPAAPGLYRDVVPVVRRPDGGLALAAPADDANAVDWVLRMARVPEADFLDARAAAGPLPPALLDALADAVAAYHAALPPIPGLDPVPAMAAIADGNLASALAAGLPAEEARAWHDECRAALDALAPWQRGRAASGMVRRGHGDLHLGNLCLWRGRPVPFDALEFDEALARIDLAYDLAFLLMDLDRRAGRAAANRVMNRYVTRTGDYGLVGGLPAFLSLRAFVLAHVQAARGRLRAGLAYLGAARAYLRPVPPVVVAVGGLQGSGKSTLAAALAPELGRAPGALVLRSDAIRKRRFGVAPEERLPESAYAEPVHQAVAAELVAGCTQVAGGGHAVIADASFVDLATRAAVADAAAGAQARFVGLWLDAPLETLASRVAARRGDASDATVAVLRRTATASPGAAGWTALPAADAPDAVLAAARRAVRAKGGAC